MLYLIAIIILIIDQLTKFFAIKFLMNSHPIVLINDFLQLSYVENYGAAFGILQNKKIFFLVVTLLLIIGIIIYLIINNKITKFMRISLVMIIGGALGNLIDRIRLGYVVDFIDIKFGKFYDYPVFNIADSAIVIATIIISYLILTDKFENK